MGNKLGRRRQVVDEKYTKPQGLYQHKNVDHKKLRKLILDSKLAPCYPGDDDCGGCDLEECPICFLYYPSLNRSRCCMKGICTECFLQMKIPNSTQPTQCPFCKTPNYAVEYRGVKSKAEKGLEQLEEQRVIEAKIRMRQQELQDEEEMMIKRKETNSSCSVRGPAEVDHCSTRAPSFASAVESEEFVGLCESYANSAERLSPRPRPNREDGFDLDLEDIMVMEAIWLSIQEAGRHCNPLYSDAPRSAGNLVEEDCSSLAAMTHATAQSSSSSSSPSSGLACAIAALAERQQTSNDTLNNYIGDDTSTRNIPGCSRYSNQEQESGNYIPAASGVVGCQVAVTGDGNDGEWVKHESNMAEVGTCYRIPDAVLPIIPRPQHDENQGSLPLGSNSIVPESFEEQMMLAMAVSLAEAQVGNGTAPEVAWH